MADEPKLKYPKCVIFIIINEACERFTYYGLRAVLTIYLLNVLLYSPDKTTVTYHAFMMLCYFTPLFGAIIADAWLGKFKTILILSLVYAGGSVVLASFSGNYGRPAGSSSNKLQEPMSLFGLLLIACGTGGIKPCVSSFGGDQFKLPEQTLQLQRFFAIFYFAINVGSLISTFITPIFREDIRCLGDDSCYPLAFGVPAVFMILATIIFVVGKRFYKIIPPKGNMVMQVTKCMCSAIYNRRHRDKSEPVKERWIDYASSNYNEELRDDIRYLLKVLVLFIPLPLFWSLYDQQGSRWTIQAMHMDGNMGVFGTMKPDQMQVINPLLILILLPLMEGVIYPCLGKFGLLRRPLQRMTVGGLLASLSFFISAVVEQRVEASREPLHADLSQLRMFNLAPCDLRLNSTSLENVVNLPKMAVPAQLALKENEENLKLRAYGPCVKEVNLTLPLRGGTDQSVYLHIEDGVLTASTAPSTKRGPRQDFDPVVRFAYAFEDGGDHEIELRHQSGATLTVPTSGKFDSTPEKTGLNVGEYTVFVDKKEVAPRIYLGASGTYSILVSNWVHGQGMQIQQVRETSAVHIMWQVPQYIVISVAEVMVSVTGLSFSFTQASSAMKSVLSAVWLLTVAIGNLVDMILADLRLFKSQVWQFVLFATLMFVDILLFAFLAMRYKYRENTFGDDVIPPMHRRRKKPEQPPPPPTTSQPPSTKKKSEPPPPSPPKK